MKLKTYVVNLKRSPHRRQYMERLLEPYSDLLEVEFIEAVDGRAEPDMERKFNDAGSLRRYGRLLSPGEKGCTLSHRKCARALLDSDAPYALIFEDDIHPVRNLRELDAIDFDAILDTPRPTVLFLSGDLWWWNKRGKIAKVFIGLGTYAYAMNRAAAKLILSDAAPHNVADDWLLFRSKGLNFRGLIPYLIDANLDMEQLGSDVDQYSWGINRRKMSKRNALSFFLAAIPKRILKATGHFESKIKVRDGKIVPGLR